MIDASSLRLGLGQFTGTEQWFRHSLCRNVFYTEGVQYLAENADCYWLIDKIATLQTLPQVKQQSFQGWKLVKTPGTHAATLACDDGNGHAVYSEQLTFTDFPLDEVDLWVEGSPDQPVILLPSEH